MFKNLISRWGRIERWLTAPTEPASFSRAAVLSPSRSRMRLSFLVIALVLIYSARAIARALLPLLLRRHPLLLISLDPATHDLLLAGLKLPVAEFVSVAVICRFVIHFVYFLLGRWYGDIALVWLYKKWRLAASALSKVEEIFRRVAQPAVFIFSDDTVCLLAGATGMSPVRFAVLHLAGTVMHIFAVLLVMRMARGPLSQALAFIDGEAATLTTILVAVTVISVVLAITLHRSKIRDLVSAARQQPDEAQGASGTNDSPDG